MSMLELSYPAIDPVALQIGPLAIHWYGLMYLFGFACAWFLAMHRAKAAHSVINRQQVESLITYGAFGVILGGRAGYEIGRASCREREAGTRKRVGRLYNV